MTADIGKINIEWRHIEWGSHGYEFLCYVWGVALDFVSNVLSEIQRPG
jgi:hypothetical protein